MKETVIQFGTGNFLRGFFDAFLDTLNKKGLYDGTAVIVSPTDSQNVEKINAAGGRYHLLLRGLVDGETVSRVAEIGSVSRAVNPYRDHDGFLSLARQPEMRFIVSNTTEAGIVYDGDCRFDDAPCASFPAKLTRLLYERYAAGLGGFAILCCELIDNNGARLKSCVERHAADWGLGGDFTAWLAAENVFCDTLVDRIVTGYPEDAEAVCAAGGFEDELLVAAEPFALWGIEGDLERELPLRAAGINAVWTEDITPLKKMKVRILNGSHTSLVFPSLLCGVSSVGESMRDPDLRRFLNVCLFDRILPALGGNGEAEAFAGAVLERFANPYIRHLWSSIALNSVSKFRARVLPTVRDLETAGADRTMPFLFSLACLLRYYKTNDVRDDAYALETIRRGEPRDILSDTALWGEDLSRFTGAVDAALDKIDACGVREAMRWSCF